MKRRAVGKRDKKSPPIGFHEWSLKTEDEVRSAIGARFEEVQNMIDAANDEVEGFLTRLIQEGCRIATEEYECCAWFPIEFGDDQDPTDPTTIYVDLPLGEDECSSPRWVFTLTELVSSLIDASGIQDGISEERKSLEAVMRSLREQADRIEAALNLTKAVKSL